MSILDLDFKSERDETPPVSDVVENPCENCGRETGYSGRGRKPRFCVDCKPKTVGSKPRNLPNKNAALAGQAAQVLFMSNSLIGFFARITRFEDTAEAIDNANPVFKEQVYDALLADPELCRTILRNGPVSGRMALIMAYMMFGAAVVPVAYKEAQIKRAERQALEEE